MCLSIAATQALAQSLDEIGYVENLWLTSHKASFPAKIDTGALTSSLNARNYEIFKKRGKKWVRFKIQSKNGVRLVVKRPIERFARIRRAGVELKRRPIIKLKACLGGKTQSAEFSLTDRTSMNYQVIVGRKFLENRFVVNPAESFLVSGKCKTKGN